MATRIVVGILALALELPDDGFISTSNSEQKEQTNREKYIFYWSISQICIYIYYYYCLILLNKKYIRPICVC